MKLLDTNVFVYARGNPSPYREACRAIVAEAGEQPSVYGVDVELLQELLDVYARRSQRKSGAEFVAEVLLSFPDPLPITRHQVEEAAGITVAHPRLSPRDAIHAAVVRTYGLEGIVSADKAFDRLPGVKRFDPLKL